MSKGAMVKIRVHEVRKAAWQARADSLGVGLSEWARSLLDHDAGLSGPAIHHPTADQRVAEARAPRTIDVPTTVVELPPSPRGYGAIDAHASEPGDSHCEPDHDHDPRSWAGTNRPKGT